MKKIDCLDGLRGLAALWVMIGHAMILSGWQKPIIGQPDLGVDLFIMLSGFLMAYQAQIRGKSEDWSAPATWNYFWIRRFFRIAPLFYTMLIIALISGPFVYASRVTVDTALGHSLQAPSRYLDAGVFNVAMHLSFLFGLLPEYAFRTPLPDWSIGLEMQFYAAFPFLFLLARRVGWIPAALLGTIAALSIAMILRAGHIVYPMPSLLALKLHLFFCGMLIAAAPNATGRSLTARFLVIICLAAIPVGGVKGPLHMIVREIIAIGFFGLVHWQRVRPVGFISSMLGRPLFHWLGELSYGVYLVHLLIMQPAAAWIFTHTGAQGPVRFFYVVAATAPLAYGIAFLTYHLIERPGQKLGRFVLRSASVGRRRAEETEAEVIAAP